MEGSRFNAYPRSWYILSSARKVKQAAPGNYPAAMFAQHFVPITNFISHETNGVGVVRRSRPF